MWPPTAHATGRRQHSAARDAPPCVSGFVHKKRRSSRRRTLAAICGPGAGEFAARAPDVSQQIERHQRAVPITRLNHSLQRPLRRQYLAAPVAFAAILLITIIGATSLSGSMGHSLPGYEQRKQDQQPQQMASPAGSQPLRADWFSANAGNAGGSVLPPQQSQRSGGVKLGEEVNKSLALLASQTSAESSHLNGMRRLLVRRLTSLIRNHEPESIAEEMEGARISGQLVSESSGDFENQAPSGERLLYGNDNVATNHHHSALIAGTDALGADNPQDQQANNAAGGRSLTNAPTEPPEQYVTCAPDYEDQTLIDAASSGNLTAEQQQQLLAGVDSAGMLNADSFQDQAEGQGAAQRPCVQPGSRMIEVITKVITPILFSIIIVVGLVGNIIVMMVILEDRKTEREYTPTGLLILDLSLADLSFIVFCIPFTGWDYSVGHWVFGSLWCKFNQYLIVVCALSSIYTLVLMSVDRFMAIVYPIECIAYRTSKNTLYAIYIKWIVILLIASPSIQMHGLIEGPQPDQYVCRFLSTMHNPLHFQIVFFITSYLFPLILIFCLYLSLLNKLWFGSKPHGHKESIKTLESKKKVTWLVAGIVVVFALCWCPIQVMLILMRLKSHRITATYVAIQVFAHTLGYMNSCVNPIVYAFASETFNNSFKRSSLGRFCYTCLCLGNPHNNNSHHHTERSSNFRTINHNNQSALMNNDMGTHYRHSQQMTNNDMLPMNNCRISRNGQDSNSSATTILNNNNHVEDSPGKLASECNQRDRHSSSPSIRSNGGPELNLVQNQQAVNHNREGEINGSSAAASSTVTLAKQQLVARMVRPGSQIAHQCEPCYQQQEPTGSICRES